MSRRRQTANPARPFVAFPAARALALCSAVLAALLLLMGAAPASAQFFSTKDGFNADGTYRVQVELTPYIWLPFLSGNAHIGGTSQSFSKGPPTAAELADTLSGAFIGAGLLRYGLFSTEIDIQYVSANESRTRAVGPLGQTLGVKSSFSMVRVAPGIGITAATGEIAGVPSMLDLRAGFAYFAWDAKVEGDRALFGGASDSDSFIQPWLGLRATFVPTPRWRIELGGMVQGFGLDSGSWGWGASALASYAITDWVNVTLGFRALDTERTVGAGALPFPDRRSLRAIAYGPILGIGFRF